MLLLSEAPSGPSDLFGGCQDCLVLFEYCFVFNNLNVDGLYLFLGHLAPYCLN